MSPSERIVDGDRMRWLFENYGFGFGRDSDAPNDGELGDFIEDLRLDFAHERSAGAAPLDAAKVLLVLSQWDGVLDVGDDRQRFVEYLVDRLGSDR